MRVAMQNKQLSLADFEALKTLDFFQLSVDELDKLLLLNSEIFVGKVLTYMNKNKTDKPVLTDLYSKLELLKNRYLKISPIKNKLSSILFAINNYLK